VFEVPGLSVKWISLNKPTFKNCCPLVWCILNYFILQRSLKVLPFCFWMYLTSWNSISSTRHTLNWLCELHGNFLPSGTSSFDSLHSHFMSIMLNTVHLLMCIWYTHVLGVGFTPIFRLSLCWHFILLFYFMVMESNPGLILY